MSSRHLRGARRNAEGPSAKADVRCGSKQRARSDSVQSWAGPETHERPDVVEAGLAKSRHKPSSRPGCRRAAGARPSMATRASVAAGWRRTCVQRERGPTVSYLGYFVDDGEAYPWANAVPRGRRGYRAVNAQHQLRGTTRVSADLMSGCPWGSKAARGALEAFALEALFSAECGLPHGGENVVAGAGESAKW